MIFGNYFSKRKKTGSNAKEIRKLCETLEPMLCMMGIVDTADIIGIETGELIDTTKRPKNIISEKLFNQLDDLIVWIQLTVEDKEFRGKIISKINLVKNYGTCELNEDSLCGTFEGQGNTYQFSMKFREHYIEYSFVKNDTVKSLAGEFKKNENNTSQIKYNDSDDTIFHLDNGTDSHNIKTVKKIHSFDENGYENFNYEMEKHDNYYINLTTGDKALHEPSPFENYTDSTYIWRAPKESIIQKQKKQYIYSEEVDSFIHNIDSFLLAHNVDPMGQRLPSGGRFVWFDKELYQEYVRGNCDIDKLWKYRGTSYQKKNN